jgi:hypothetical protein|tara:strand:+ start:111 stop:347 length:237 start_codon:yes stop_codon:yes gene_type:complete
MTRKVQFDGHMPTLSIPSCQLWGRALPMGRSAYNRADYIERRRPMMTWWSEHIQGAATGNLSMSAIKENRDRKVVSIR